MYTFEILYDDNTTENIINIISIEYKTSKPISDSSN